MSLQPNYKLFLLLILVIGMAAPVVGQPDIEGFYIGKLNFLYRGVTINVQLDIQKVPNDAYAVMLRTREVNRGSIIGCDFLLKGELVDNTLLLDDPTVVSAHQQGYFECLFFKSARLRLTIKNGAIEMKGVLMYNDKDNVARLQISRADSVPSFVTQDQIKQGERIKFEVGKLRELPAEEWARLIFSAREKILIDTLTIKTGQPLALWIKGYETIGWERLSVYVNGNPLAIIHKVHGPVLKIPIHTDTSGSFSVIFINHHPPPLNQYFLTMQLRQDGVKTGSRNYLLTTAVNHELRILVKP